MNKQEWLEYRNAKHIIGNDVCDIYYVEEVDINKDVFYNLMIFPKGKAFKYQNEYTSHGITFDEMSRYAQSLADAEIARRDFDNSRLVEIGDIMMSVWGYEQTNVTYYQVIGLKGKRSAILCEIEQERIPSKNWCEYKVKPIRDQFIGDSFSVRIKGDSCRINEYQSATLEKPDESGNYREMRITEYA